MAYKARERGAKVETSNAETVQILSAPVIELQTKDFLTVAEACQLLNVSRWTLARAIKDERLKAARLGKRIVIKRSDVDRLFNWVLDGGKGKKLWLKFFCEIRN